MTQFKDLPLFNDEGKPTKFKFRGRDYIKITPTIARQVEVNDEGSIFGPLNVGMPADAEVSHDSCG